MADVSLAPGMPPSIAVALALIPGVLALAGRWLEQRSAQKIEHEKEREEDEKRSDDFDIRMRERMAAENVALLRELREERDRANARIVTLETIIQDRDRELDRVRDLARYWNDATHSMRHAANNKLMIAQRPGATPPTEMPKVPPFDERAYTKDQPRLDFHEKNPTPKAK